jgi:hypothetical protein
MRTSSFSSNEVVKIISEFFVPVWMSNDDYARTKKSTAEKAELARVKRQTSSKKMVNGDVNVFLLDPDGEVIDTMGVAKAMEPQNLLPFLKKHVSERGLKSRDPEDVKASTRPTIGVPESQAPGGLMLHVCTRYLPPREAEAGCTDDFVELTAAELTSLYPPPDSKVGTSWDVANVVGEKLFPFCYPAVCHYDSKASKLGKSKLKAVVSEITPTEIQVSLSGVLEMDHSRDGRIDGRISANLVGLLRYDRSNQTIKSLQIASENGEYLWHWEGRPSRYPIGFVIEGPATMSP